MTRERYLNLVYPGRRSWATPDGISRAFGYPNIMTEREVLHLPAGAEQSPTSSEEFALAATAMAEEQTEMGQMVDSPLLPLPLLLPPPQFRDADEPTPGSAIMEQTVDETLLPKPLIPPPEEFKDETPMELEMHTVDSPLPPPVVTVEEFDDAMGSIEQWIKEGDPTTIVSQADMKEEDWLWEGLFEIASPTPSMEDEEVIEDDEINFNVIN